MISLGSLPCQSAAECGSPRLSLFYPQSSWALMVESIKVWLYPLGNLVRRVRRGQIASVAQRAFSSVVRKAPLLRHIIKSVGVVLNPHVYFYVLFGHIPLLFCPLSVL